jgi:hypothetical protein
VPVVTQLGEEFIRPDEEIQLAQRPTWWRAKRRCRPLGRRSAGATCKRYATMSICRLRVAHAAPINVARFPGRVTSRNSGGPPAGARRAHRGARHERSIRCRRGHHSTSSPRSRIDCWAAWRAGCPSSDCSAWSWASATFCWRCWWSAPSSAIRFQAEKYSLEQLPANHYLWGVAINGAVVGLFYLVLGIWTRSAAASFQKIVDTKGNDIMHLMNALSSVYGMYSLIWTLLVLTLLAALLGLALTVYLAFMSH